MMETILRDLRQPEYIHVLINPLPVYGMAVALIGLIIALFLRQRAPQVVALILVLISAVSAWPAAHFGEEGYDRVLSLADEDGQAWLAAHAHRADQLVFVFYVTATFALAALLAPKKWPRAALPLTIATLIGVVASLGAGGYIAYAGGKIRHREFRNASPPPKPSNDN